MRVTESLIHQNKIKNRKKNQFNEDDEPTMRYKEERREYFTMNQSKSVFGSRFQEGVNVEKSIFDKKAVFRTDNTYK